MNSLASHSRLLEEARERLAVGESNIAAMEAELLETVSRRLNQGQGARAGVEDDAIRGRLFGVPEKLGTVTGIPPIAALKSAGAGGEEGIKAGQDAPAPPTSATAVEGVAAQQSGQFDALPADIRVIMERGGDLRARVIESRDLLVKQYVAADNKFDAHRKGYRNTLKLHLGGQHPGLPGWTLT